MTVPPRTTAELNARLARDLDAAFADLVRTHQDGIFSGVRSLLPHGVEAEDIAQETFVRAFRALRGYSPEQIQALSLPGWLWTIALNLCRNAARTRARKPPGTRLEAVGDPAGDADTAAEAEATVAAAEWSLRLRALPRPMRAAVVLRHVAGLSYREIAVALDRPVGTVKADVSRGLDRLRRRLEEEGERR